MLYILFAVYLAAINFFALLFVRKQKKAAEGALDKPKYRDGKLLLAALLGGALGAFLTMLFSKFRTDNILLMILLPLFIVLNVYAVVSIFRSGIFVSPEGKIKKQARKRGTFCPALGTCFFHLKILFAFRAQECTIPVSAL